MLSKKLSGLESHKGKSKEEEEEGRERKEKEREGKIFKCDILSFVIWPVISKSQSILVISQHRGSTKVEAIKGVLAGLWCAWEIDGVSEPALAGMVWEGQTGTLIPAMVWGSQRGGSEQQKAMETSPASQRIPKPEETSGSIFSSSLLFLLYCIP